MEFKEAESVVLSGTSDVVIDSLISVGFDKDSLQVDHTQIEVGRADTFTSSSLKLIVTELEHFFLFISR